MSKITYRAATLDDLPILYAFEQGIVEAERPYNPTLKAGEINYYDLAAYVKDPNVEVLVAVLEEEIIASGYAKIKASRSIEVPEKHAYLGFMYVKPEHRRKGVNRILMQALLDWAKSKNLKEVRLDVYSENESAVRAYEKTGFRALLTEMRMKLD